MSVTYFDQLLLAARQVYVVYLDQLLRAAHYVHYNNPWESKHYMMLNKYMLNRIINEIRNTEQTSNDIIAGNGSILNTTQVH